MVSALTITDGNTTASSPALSPVSPSISACSNKCARERDMLYWLGWEYVTSTTTHTTATVYFYITKDANETSTATLPPGASVAQTAQPISGLYVLTPSEYLTV